MKLILWRHASANSFNGYDRMLDATGHAQAKQGALWLQNRFPKATLWASLAKRAQETAAHFATPEDHHALNPGKKAQDIYHHILAENASDELIVVGHLPWIEILAQLLAGNNQPFHIHHGMVLVFSGDFADGFTLAETYQPQPVTG